MRNMSIGPLEIFRTVVIIGSNNNNGNSNSTSNFKNNSETTFVDFLSYGPQKTPGTSSMV